LGGITWKYAPCRWQLLPLFGQLIASVWLKKLDIDVKKEEEKKKEKRPIATQNASSSNRISIIGMDGFALNRNSISTIIQSSFP